MAHLKEIIGRINVIISTKQMTSTVKMVSMTKLHRTQQQLYHFKQYKDQCSAMFASVRNIDQITHPLLEKQTQGPKRLLLIVVTSDRGMCGAFNKNVLKSANQYIKTRQNKTPNSIIEVLTIGKKANQFFKKNNLTIIDQYIDLINKPENSDLLANHCINTFQEGYYSEVILCYTTYKNASKQQVVIEPLLPFKRSTVQQPLNMLQYAIYEPTPQKLFNKLIQTELHNTIKLMLLESIVSEHAIRVVTMGKASDNANELLTQLRISYNRTRQALITNALAEITSGAESLIKG